MVTGAETWLHHFVPELKLKLAGGYHMTVRRRKKFKSVPSMGSVAVVVWGGKGVILVTFLFRQTRMKY